jgi:hypothetical protein
MPEIPDLGQTQVEGEKDAGPEQKIDEPLMSAQVIVQ